MKLNDPNEKLLDRLFQENLTLFGHLIKFGWFVSADIAYLDGLNQYSSNKSIQDVGKAH